MKSLSDKTQFRDKNKQKGDLFLSPFSEEL